MKKVSRPLRDFDEQRGEFRKPGAFVEILCAGLKKK
jgi:hypothetical protein